MSSYSSAFTKEKNPYFDTQEQSGGQELSKGLLSSLRRSNELRKKAFPGFFDRQIPRGERKELVIDFNKAVREYNKSRSKLINITKFGYEPGTKLFTIQEILENTAKVFQRIADTLSKYPKNRTQPVPESSRGFDDSYGKQRINRLRIAGTLLGTAAVLAACMPNEAIVSPSQEAPGNQETDPNSTQGIIDSTSEGQEVDPNSPEATEVTAAELETLNTDINQKIDEAVAEAEKTNPAAAVQFVESNGAETAATIFANRLAEERILDPKAYEISLISTNGQARLELTAKSPWGEAGDVSVIDTGEKDGMFLSLEGGLEALGISATPENVKNYDIFFDEGGWYALIQDKSGNTIGVVGQEKKWTADIENATQLEQIDESKLSYEQQKTMIENRYEQGSTAYEAVIKDDGNLEYYDGSWHTLEAMRNVNGEIIPWGESYDMNSEEGRDGILTNIMGGNEAAMNAHIKTFDNHKKDAEKKGYDTSNFNVLYVQFLPNAESLARQTVSEKMGYYSMDGQIVIKNDSGKIFVINIETCFSDMVMNTYVKDEITFLRSSSDLYIEKNFKESFLAINSSDILNYKLGDLNAILDKPVEKTWMENVLNSNMENFSKKLESDPSSISKDLYNIRYLIYFN